MKVCRGVGEGEGGGLERETEMREHSRIKRWHKPRSEGKESMVYLRGILGVHEGFALSIQYGAL